MGHVEWYRGCMEGCGGYIGHMGGCVEAWGAYRGVWGRLGCMGVIGVPRGYRGCLERNMG